VIDSSFSALFPCAYEYPFFPLYIAVKRKKNIPKAKKKAPTTILLSNMSKNLEPQISMIT
jgi:hypothetical protein